MAENREKTFEESMAALEKAAADISKGTTSLESSIKLFEEGMKEAEFCRSILDEARGKIEIYGKDGEE